MLLPSRPKYRKAHKGRIHGKSKAGYTLNFGSYGMKSLNAARVTSRQIEAARRAMTRHLRRSGKMWIRIFPDVPVSQKPAEARQGKGKGSVEYWICRVKPGRILFELDGVPQVLAVEAFRLATAKLPLRSRVVMRTQEKDQ